MTECLTKTCKGKDFDATSSMGLYAVMMMMLIIIMMMVMRKSCFGMKTVSNFVGRDDVTHKSKIETDKEAAAAHRAAVLARTAREPNSLQWLGLNSVELHD